MVNNPDLDCSGGTPKEKESIKFLNSICLNYDLIDIFCPYIVCKITRRCMDKKKILYI